MEENNQVEENKIEENKVEETIEVKMETEVQEPITIVIKEEPKPIITEKQEPKESVKPTTHITDTKIDRFFTKNEKNYIENPVVTLLNKIHAADEKTDKSKAWAQLTISFLLISGNPFEIYDFQRATSTNNNFSGTSYSLVVQVTVRDPENKKPETKEKYFVNRNNKVMTEGGGSLPDSQSTYEKHMENFGVHNEDKSIERTVHSIPFKGSKSPDASASGGSVKKESPVNADQIKKAISNKKLDYSSDEDFTVSKEKLKDEQRKARKRSKKEERGLDADEVGSEEFDDFVDDDDEDDSESSSSSESSEEESTASSSSSESSEEARPSKKHSSSSKRPREKHSSSHRSSKKRKRGSSRSSSESSYSSTESSSSDDEAAVSKRNVIKKSHQRSSKMKAMEIIPKVSKEENFEVLRKAKKAATKILAAKAVAEPEQKAPSRSPSPPVIKSSKHSSSHSSKHHHGSKEKSSHHDKHHKHHHHKSK